jgi:hypothetical protein
MKNKKLLVLGGLAVLGVLAYNYYSKNKGTGYSNATGRIFRAESGERGPWLPGSCKRCRTTGGDIYVPRADTTCSRGETCLSSLEIAD